MIYTVDDEDLKEYGITVKNVESSVFGRLEKKSFYCALIIRSDEKLTESEIKKVIQLAHTAEMPKE